MGNDKVMCKRCILHSHVPGVEISEQGYCSFCETDEKAAQETGQAAGGSEKPAEDLTKRLEEKVAAVKKENRMYDAILLFSGGKDSTYLLHFLKTKFKLRILCLSMMYPIGKERASLNIDDVSKKFGVDIMKFFPDETMYKKYMKYVLLEGHKYQTDEKMCCYACSFIFRWVSIKLAIKLGIPMVFIGTDKTQTNGASWYSRGEDYNKGIAEGKKPLGKDHDIFADAVGAEYNGSIYDFNADELKNAAFPDFIAPFTFLDYNYMQAIGEIENLGLKSDNFKTLLTNCDAAYLFDYITYRKFDCPSYIKMYATGIRKHLPTISQLSGKPKDARMIPRDEMIAMIDDYRKVLYYVVDNHLDLDTITDAEKAKIKEMAATSYRYYGKETADFFIDRILKINYFINYFEIDVNNVLAV